MTIEEQAKHRMFRNGKTTVKVVDLGAALGSMKLVLQLGEAESVRKKADPISTYIAEAIESKKPAAIILAAVKKQAEENPTLMGQIIGEELTLEILRS